VACIDARVEPNSILGGTQGDYHVIRNAGGIVTNDVIRSLIVSQYHGTTRVVVMMHTDCGAMAYPADEERRRLEAETGEQANMLYGFDDLETELARGVDRLRQTKLLPHRDGVRGVIYDVDTGAVRPVIE
jgi:carbonic anhydrase